MAKQRTKTLGSNLPIPSDDTAAANAVREIGDKGREVARLEADLGDAKAALDDEYAAKVAPLNARIAELKGGLEAYCAVHRDRLTRDGRVKFHRFPTGLVSWRFRPAKVTIRGKDAVIDAIEASRTLRAKFLRIKKEPNREAMLEDRDAAMQIPGVTIGSDGEDFIIEPNEAELAEGGAV